MIRPIAFRPTPGASSGSSTPTNGYVVSSYRPNSANMANMQVPHFDYSGPPHIRASPATSSSHVMMGPGQQPPLPPLPPGHPSCNGEGFPPGHPLVKDGKRHYGSKNPFSINKRIENHLPLFNLNRICFYDFLLVQDFRDMGLSVLQSDLNYRH